MSKSNGCGTVARWLKRTAATTALLLASASASRADIIFVTTTEQKISDTGGCSLQEAIFSANLDDNRAIATFTEQFNNDTTPSSKVFTPVEVRTQCAPGSGDDVIVLPYNATFEMDDFVRETANALGRTATPIIRSTIRIDAHGSTFINAGGAIRLFAVEQTGRLTLRAATVSGFKALGGRGGFGGGGGLGAGGAIYVRGGTVVVEGSTFSNNSATGGKGGEWRGAPSGGGGGGMGGWGGAAWGGSGGGGGGSIYSGESSWSLNHGGGGGGSVSEGYNRRGGYDCGGDGADGWPLIDRETDGHNAKCDGGGGGAGRQGITFLGGSGGSGKYGGGGAGGGEGGGDGGSGGFGGGGGAGWYNGVVGAYGGDAGFGGGGGAGDGVFADPGDGGHFGGKASTKNGGGGGGLGGAIFSDGGTVRITNSTFAGNVVTGGEGATFPDTTSGRDGRSRGGAIFSRDGVVELVHVTISGNTSAGGVGGGLWVYQDDASTLAVVITNSIIAGNGNRECGLEGSVTGASKGNIIASNDEANPCAGVVSSDDPMLGALRDNDGPTPTMGLFRGSPAINAAHPDYALRADQRGQERPENGADIGAFEWCVLGILEEPCPILAGTAPGKDPEAPTVSLTVSASPSGTGTTSPSGTAGYPINSVIVLTATPAAGYRFTGWSGDGIANPSSASTTVVLAANRSVIANFELIPDFTFGTIAPIALPVGGSGSTTVSITANATFHHQTTFSVTGVPSGAQTSFTPASLTPEASSTVSTIFTITPGPTVLPGTYVLTVKAESSEVTKTTTVDVTVEASLDGAIAVVDLLDGAGCITTSGVGSALRAKLAAARSMVAAGQVRPALNTLDALLRQLQHITAKQVISTCQLNGEQFDAAQVLIAQVQALIDSLGGAALANPLVGSALNQAGAGVAGATVTLSSGKKALASAATDVTGFFYFPATQALAVGSDYTVSISVPKGYRSATPSSQTVRWRGSETVVGTMTLK